MKVNIFQLPLFAPAISRLGGHPNPFSRDTPMLGPVKKTFPSPSLSREQAPKPYLHAP